MTGMASARGKTFAFMVRALRYKNYRLFFCGQIVSLCGTWMTSVATSWLVYRLTGSALLLGVVGFAGQFPSFLLSPLAGIFVDRWDRHRLLLLTQTLLMLQSFTLAFLTLTGRIGVTSLILLQVFQGLVNAFDMPCRQAFVAELIERKSDLSNAIALNSSMINASRLVGPSIGGMVIAAAGEGWCFFIDGVSFIAVLAAVLAMTVPPRPPRTRTEEGILSQLREGWDYAFGLKPIRAIILLLALLSLTGLPYLVLVPIFAGKVLGGGPHTLGFLMAATGCGALSAALWLASRTSVLGLGRIIPLAAGTFGAGLIAFSFSRTLWLSLALLVIVGAGFMLEIASSNTIVQTIVDDDKRGRVMSFFNMSFLGMAPFGGLVAGSLADRWGAPRTLAAGGACCVVGALWFARGLPELRAAIRPIYIRMGILPQVAAAMEASGELSVPPED